MARHTADSPLDTETSCRSRFRIQLGTRSDDAELRALLRDVPMDGPVGVTLRREPSYFDAAVVEGPDRHVLTVRDTSADRLVGMGTWSVRARFMHGVPQDVGYLGGLRIMPDYRSFGLLARGYRALRESCHESNAKFYLTTIAEGNRRALEMLTKGRAGLPAYHYLGRYYSCVLPLKPRRQRDHAAGLEVRPASSRDRLPLVEHLQCVGQQLNFCPRYEAADFFNVDATFKDLRPQDILLALRGGEIVGTVGAWDQTAFRQIVVERYPPLQDLVRPLYNAWSKLRGGPCFPAAGQPVRHLLAAIPLAQNGDPAILMTLLNELRRRADRTRHDAVVAGVYELDPLLPALRAEAVFTYVTRVYLVSWDDIRLTLARLQSENLYLELGCL